ncbi:MAG: nitroreductase family protein [Lautropia sp.]
MPPSQLGLSREIAIGLLQDAILAPSSYNAQPWYFRIRDGGIDLNADRTCALAVNDPDDREMTIGCGCALFNLRVAAAHACVPIRVRLLPDSAAPDLMATIELGSSGIVPEDLAALHPAIAKRRTHRGRFADAAVPPEQTRRLVDAASAEQAWLAVIGASPQSLDLRRQAGELIAEGDATLWADASWRREQASWLHPRRERQGIAIPGLGAPIAQAVVRTFDLGGGVAARDRQLVDASPLLVVVGTDGDGPEHWLLAGQALERVLLTACSDGLQASFLNQPIVVPALRERLHRLLGTRGRAQLLLRLGQPLGESHASARRPLAEVVDVGPD